MTDDMPGPDAEPRGDRARTAGAQPPHARVSGARAAGAEPSDRAAGAAPGYRRPLTRSPQKKIIGGVCAGLGRYFGLDPVIFRVVLGVLALTGGVGLISYGIGWLLIPMDGEEETEVRRLLSGRIEGGSMTAVFCALVGSGLFLSTIDNGNSQGFSICLIAAVVAAVYWLQQRRAGLAAAAEAPAPWEAAGPQAPPAAQPPPTDSLSWWRTPAGRVSFEKTGSRAGAAGSTDRHPGYLWGPDDSGGDPGGRDAPRSAPRPARPPQGEHRGSVFGLVVVVLAAAAAAIGIRAAWHGHPLGTILEYGLVPALAVLGLGLVVGAFAGHRGWGLVCWAVLASALLAGAATLPKSVGTDWHRVTWRPATVAQVRAHYRLGAGQGVLDLSGLALHGGTATTSVGMGAGRLQVQVPGDATVRVRANVGLGEVRFPGSGRHGVVVAPGRRREGTFPPPPGTRSDGTITLALHLGAGQVEVLRGPAS